MGKRNPFGADIVPDEEKEMIKKLEKERMERQRKENARSDYRRQNDDSSLDSFALGMTTGVVVGPQSGIGASVYWSSHNSGSDSSSSSSDSSSYSGSSSSSDSSSSSSD